MKCRFPFFVPFTFFLVFPSPFLHAADAEQPLLLEEQRRQQFERQMQVQADVRPESSDTEQSVPVVSDDLPCFLVDEIVLDGEEAGRFRFALDSALKQSGFVPGMCLGAQGVNRIMVLAQNALIGKGYTTSRILAAPQDLKGGKLVLTVFPGRIGSIRFDQSDSAQTHSERMGSFANVFPSGAGDVLNLRDLEQGLENLKRIPTADADIRIESAKNDGVSDVVVQWRSRAVPYRLSLGLDNGGAKATGRYQGNVVFFADNPFGLSDSFYASVGREIGHGRSEHGVDGSQVEGRSNSYAFHYSVPFGRWQWTWNHSRYRYHQAVAGVNEVYDYNGKSSNSDLGVSRMLYRDAARKLRLGVKLWQRQTQSYIDDAEIEVQRRRLAGWSVQLSHREYLGHATLDFGLGYKRGTGRNSSLEDPGEAFGEGTSRLKLVTADVSVGLPFRIGGQPFVYDGVFYRQWNRTPLSPQDRLSIGSRYSVRGFDGESSLSGERGWYWRNDLGWQYAPSHRLYVGLDTGRVSGRSARYGVGQSLTGAVVGVRGQFEAGGQVSYDLFAGRPLKKPEGLRTAKNIFGFHVNYSF